ncbi:MAG: serine/threonine protein kinase, partial [Pseudorhodoplanes sp.]|nr:serine/threonine protein kinase [Pseudorhodoplanes sp.]
MSAQAAETAQARRNSSIPAEVAATFRSTVILKQDVFSTVERGFFRTADGEVEAV